MRIAELLNVRPGLTALIGGGGKTTLMLRLAKELREKGTVLICTSTHICRPEACPVLTTGDAAQVQAALKEHGAVCIGTLADRGKLTAPQLPFELLPTLADYVLVEADGSKMLPLKAHLPHEPVIPPNAGQTILVVGADGFGKPIAEVCHRAAHWAELADAQPTDPVTPERLAKVLLREGLGERVYINKAETAEAAVAARALAALLPCPVAAGSLWREEYSCLS